MTPRIFTAIAEKLMKAHDHGHNKGLETAARILEAHGANAETLCLKTIVNDIRSLKTTAATKDQHACRSLKSSPSL